MPRFWKSLASRRVTPARQDEFPEELPVGEAVRQVSRRDFFRWSGLGFAVGLATGCDHKKAEKALSYLQGQEGVTPGTDLWYASTSLGCPCGCGVLAKVRDGRPIKLEGNPEHPLGRGALCTVGQAQVRSLYDGGRQTDPTLAGRAASWADLDRDLLQKLQAIRQNGGKVRVLSSTVLSPSLRKAVLAFTASFKDGRHVCYDALSLSALPDAYARTHGQRLMPAFRLEKADVIVGVEADFLGAWIAPGPFGRAYAQRRNPDAKEGMSRHIQVESGLSLTGSNADERVRVAPLEAVAFLEHLCAAVEGQGSPRRSLEAAARKQVREVAEALLGAKGRSLLLCGLNDLHAQVFAARVNHALGNEGATLDLSRPCLLRQGDDAATAALIQEMRAGEVAALLVLDANPVYELSALGFSAALAKVGVKVGLGLHTDETASLCTHHAPDHHWMEAWRDAEPEGGTFGIVQPLLGPLFRTRDAAESLLLWAGSPRSAQDWVKACWREDVFPKTQSLAFDAFWTDALLAGYIATAGAPAPAYREDRGATDRLWSTLPAPASSGLAFQALLYAKCGLLDGRQANNPWLQELPDPITKITWDNYAQLSPAAAKSLRLEQGDVVRLKTPGRPDLALPVVVQPGLHDRTVAVALGYGRAKAGKHGSGVGVDAYPWLGAAGPVEISPTPQKVELACTQDHHLMEGRELVREMGWEQYRKDPASARPHTHPGGGSLYAPQVKGAHHWAMVIDLSKCSGCSACVISCQAENNIPVVGKDEVRRKREMHWMRIDRYYTGDESDPGVVHQPLMCQQCDNAPCENVCPVLATVHSDEGLNQQVYNRCVGTRYCANNCPYKTRRFNWFEYDHADPVERLALNPDVTVRSRGVMEKCSFCIQRIQQAKATAKNEGRELKGGELKTACQQSCPGLAIVFGDLKDPESEVSRLVAQDPKRYALLGELGVLPNVSYLTRIRNREVESEGGGHGA